MTSGNISPTFIWQVIGLSLLAYVVIASMTIFFASLFRNIGPSIPVVIVLILICSGMATISQVLTLFNDGEDTSSMTQLLVGVGNTLKAINPIHSILVFNTETTAVVVEEEMQITTTISITWKSFWTEVANNIVYIAAFFVGGLLIFKKRDVK